MRSPILIGAGLAVGLIVLLIAALAAVGAALPRDHVARVSAHINRPPAEVAARIRDPAGYPRWRPDVKAVEGVERGADGATRFREVGRHGAVRYRLAETEPGARFVSTIESPDLPYGGQWTFALTPDGTGTRVEIEERGFVKNPVFRALARFVFGYEATMRGWLGDLGR